MAKGASLLLLLLSSMLLLATEAAAVAAEGALPNKSSSLGGFVWATGKGEGDLIAMVESPEESFPVEDEISGGFSSLEGMLQWAIGHSDPEKLKEKAKDVQGLSGDELKKRQLEIKDLMEKLKVPSDAELMKIAIADLNNSSITLEDRQRSLDELLFLVDPIDNANDLDKLGGLVVVIRELDNSEADIRTTSAWILGKASQNNALVQNQILTYGGLVKLMKMVGSSSKEEAIKALYAVSALVRNNEIGQKMFYAEEGNIMLQDIMSNSSVDIRLRKKAAFLVADLSDYQQQYADNSMLHFLGDRFFLKAVVDLLLTPDLDLQEKALLAVRSLLQLTSTIASDLRDFCRLDQVLESMREGLDNSNVEEDLKDYSDEIESLRKEVLILFHNKLSNFQHDNSSRIKYLMLRQ
ncbi:hsp70 nucleotide exchange factor FES1-like isoform X1 [Zingiber officinale]|uniref:hsp70 nucleotide exchange factor FES1-like isoform X1 n=1 Tax=Zingiber officinale TaxID=94328 RepID=UPI001C4BF8DD|nr:hsp70 nucleotide exchange factor FES1-like isoform X1 [Zingiber officinale]